MDNNSNQSDDTIEYDSADELKRINGNTVSKDLDGEGYFINNL